MLVSNGGSAPADRDQQDTKTLEPCDVCGLRASELPWAPSRAVRYLLPAALLTGVLGAAWGFVLFRNTSGTVVTAGVAVGVMLSLAARSIRHWGLTVTAQTCTVLRGGYTAVIRWAEVTAAVRDRHFTGGRTLLLVNGGVLLSHPLRRRVKRNPGVGIYDADLARAAPDVREHLRHLGYAP